MSLIDTLVFIEDCNKIVEKNFGKQKVTNFEVTNTEQKFGFLGEHYRLTIEINNETNINCFVKVPPSQESTKEFVDNTGAAFKEMNFFAKIIPDFLNNKIDLIAEVVPKHYLATEKSIIMQDLKSESFVMLSSRESMNIEHFKTGLCSLAKFHASGIIYEEKMKESGKINWQLNEIYPEEFKEAFYTSTEMSQAFMNAGKSGLAEEIKIFSNYTSTISAEEFLDIAEKFVDDYVDLVKPSGKYRNTISHGDLWANNIMFNFATNQAILVDFQSYRYCPPSHDLMQFIYFAVNRKNRAKYMQEFLDFYFSQFKECIEKYGYAIHDVMCYRDFLDSCEFEKKFAITQCSTHFQTILMGKETVERFFKDNEYCRKSFFGDRTEHVTTSIEQDAAYRERTRESIIDLREICEEYAEDNL